MKVGELERFIGMQIKITKNKIIIHQQDYIDKLLDHYNMSNCNGSKTPLPTGNPVQFNDEHDPSIETEFRSLISSLQYIARLTRSDIAYHVGILSSKLNSPSKNDLQLSKRILRYIKHTRNYCMIFSNDLSNSNLLHGFSDANFGVENKGLSRSGIISTMLNNTIQWSSKLQNIPALSTCEAEWYSVDSLHRELLWIREILIEIGLTLEPTPIYCDNLPTIRILKNEFPTLRTRHVERSFYHLKYYLQNNTFDLIHVSTNDQPADILTKSLPIDKHYHYLSYLCLFNTTEL